MVKVDSYFHPYLVLPIGETKDSLLTSLSSYCVEDGDREEMKNYLQEHLLRFLYTYSLLPKGEGGLLEIGSNPYYMSMIIRNYTEYKLYCTNYFIGDSSSEDRVQYVINIKEKDKLEFKYKHFNVENSQFPYADNFFEVVLFCEVLEHLAKDPHRALLEIKRVLKPGGILILSTPNVARIENVIKILLGANIYDPYSKHGIYGRHNREYSRHELFLLLKHCGFEFEDAFTSDCNQPKGLDQKYLKKIKKLLKSEGNRLYDMGQHIFIRAKSTGKAEVKKPSWLYNDYPSGQVI
jgi:SAM-dependent methyltransferase